MKTLSKYCKAYTLQSFYRYAGWNPDTTVSIQEPQQDGTFIERVLNDNDIVFLHENYGVTTGIYSNEGVIFRDDREEWFHYCNYELKFNVSEDN